MSVGKPIKIPQSGFSLLELLIVMAIIGMAVAMVIPRIGSSEVTVLKAQVREAVAVLNYARRSAIVESKQKVASFYQSQKKEGEATPGRWETGDGDASLQPDGEVSEEAVYQISFYPEGGSSGGEIILTHLDYKAKISVNPITGKIESEILYE
ncbi:MAG: prepilin-type N-terminal cleavage/methylation domain-containing protein [Pseudomonadota bacterium]